MHQQQYNVLLIEDDREDYFIIRDLMQDIPGQPYQLEWIDSYEEGRKAILADDYDACLVDYLLEDGNGLDLIRSVNHSNKIEFPILLLTGKGNIEVDRNAMEAGASDYLVKGALSPHSLDRAIRYNIRHIENLQAIRELNKNLEAKVGERTRELAASLEKEKELNEMKSRFVSMASHEFRTPLSTILSSTSLIEKHNQNNQANDKITKHVHRIQNAVNNLTDILNDFLSLEKLEEGAIQPNFTNIDIPTFAERIKDDMQEIAKEGQVIHYEHQGNQSHFYSDKQLLRNIIYNLLSNAIKYSPASSVIHFHSRLDQDHHLQMTITDQGIGIPKEELGNMFSRFFRARNALHYQGTGLGMNIVKKYVDLLKGHIDINSEEGEGTSIHIQIPPKEGTHDKNSPD